MLDNKNIEQIKEILSQVDELTELLQTAFELYNLSKENYVKNFDLEELKGEILFIAINGANGIGKDTFAYNLKKYIENDNEYQHIANVRVLSFADPLKNIVMNTFNTNKEELEYLKRKENAAITIFGNTMRDILNNLGEAVKNMFGKDVFVRHLLNRVYQEHKSNKLNIIIIPDLRFDIEDTMLDNKFIRGVLYFPIELKLKNSDLDKVGDFNLDNAVFSVELEEQKEMDAYVDLLFKQIMCRVKEGYYNE